MSRTAQDRLVAATRQQVEAERQHREAVTKELERARSMMSVEIRSLMGQYPPLRRLLAILTEAAALQDPQKGRAIDGASPLVRAKGSVPGDEGAATRQHRMRVRRWIRRLEGITRDFEQEIGGQVPEDVEVVRLQCWRKSCAGRGRHQPWGATKCKWCGREFGDG